MKTKVVNIRKEQYDVYIGRPSKWGNPFSHLGFPYTTLAKFKVRSRQEAIDKYAEWIKTQPKLMEALPELAGKRLGCFCKPAACHGDVLVELVEKWQKAK